MFVCDCFVCLCLLLQRLKGQRGGQSRFNQEWLCLFVFVFVCLFVCVLEFVGLCLLLQRVEWKARETVN